MHQKGRCYYVYLFAQRRPSGISLHYRKDDAARRLELKRLKVVLITELPEQTDLA